MPNFMLQGTTWVFGMTGGGFSAHTRDNAGNRTRNDAPTTGVYGMVISGGLALDASVNFAFSDFDRTTAAGAVTRINVDNVTYGGNASYRNYYGTWRFEPTAGVSTTASDYDNASKALGYRNGHQTRVQGGAGFGTTWDWSGTQVSFTLTGLAYEDVVVTGNTLVGATLVPTDQGKTFGLGNAKLSANLGYNWSGYVEGEARGRDHVFGAAVRAACATLSNNGATRSTTAQRIDGPALGCAGPFSCKVRSPQLRRLVAPRMRR